MNSKLDSCNCPFCTMPRILSLAIKKGAFADPTPAPTPTPISARRISMATFGRQLTSCFFSLIIIRNTTISRYG